MKKVLILASVASMIDQFNMANITILKRMGCEVHVAANFVFGSTSSKERVGEFRANLEADGIKVYDIPFCRKVFDLRNFPIYQQLKALFAQESYTLIHCQSPVGGVLARLAARATRKAGTKIVYTAHGFHFYQGAPLVNWLVFYPVEKWLAWSVDVLITINQEDYQRAQRFKAKKVVYLPGIGIDTRRIANLKVDKVAKYQELGLPEQAKVILSVGELNRNKNHETIIKAFAKLNRADLYYLICGHGELENYLKKLCAELAVSDRVIFAGYRRDIMEIYKIADVFIFPSYREGLSVALMEAMAAGLPVIASQIRGNIDLIENGQGGLLCKADNPDGFLHAIGQLVDNQEIGRRMRHVNLEKIKKFDGVNVNSALQKIDWELLMARD